MNRFFRGLFSWFDALKIAFKPAIVIDGDVIRFNDYRKTFCFSFDEISKIFIYNKWTITVDLIFVQILYRNSTPPQFIAHDLVDGFRGLMQALVERDMVDPKWIGLMPVIDGQERAFVVFHRAADGTPHRARVNADGTDVVWDSLPEPPAWGSDGAV